MNTIIKHSFLALGAVALLAGCDENDWNDKLDGFEEPQPGASVETLAYTLTGADYYKISGLDDDHQKPYIGLGTAEERNLIYANRAFADEAEARLFIPAFLRDSTNNFFALANGSAVKVTYNVSANRPQSVLLINKGVELLTLSEDDYQTIWDSKDNYIDAFAPSHPFSSRTVNGILKAEFPDAEAGQYAVVTYNEATENPIFGTIGGDEPDVPEPSFQPTSVIGSAAEGDVVEIKGYITAIDNRGFILTDNSGSILCYQASGFDVASVAVGNQISLSGEVGSYGKGLQIAITEESYTVEGTGAYTYPAPVVYTGAMMDEAVARTGNELAQYVQFTGTASVSGNYYNFAVDGASTAQGSGYQVPQFIRDQITAGETYIVRGYFASVSSGKFFNVVITSVENAANASKAPAHRAPVNDVTTTVKNAILYFDGTSWLSMNGVEVLQPADYKAMGQTYPNLSGSLPSQLLPIYLKNSHPYAEAGDEIVVAYNYYNGSGSSYQAAQYIFNGSDWALNAGETTSQFVKRNGFWVFDPSVVITLPESRTEPSLTYYTAAVNWVFNNISKPMGGVSLKEGPYMDAKYGNSEFYSGTSFYYCNVDIRGANAKSKFPELYEEYADDEVTALMQKRFCLETMPAVLAQLNPDAVPVDGMEVTYTVNFTAYTGARSVETVVYTVTGKGQFQYKSCTWFANGEDADWK
jgi:hypothetical protein